MTVDESRKKKVEAYIKEIDEISKKYQLKLTPIIQYTAEGAFPRFTVADMLPPAQKPKKKKPIDKT